MKLIKRTALEERRKRLTVLFGIFVATLTLCLESQWSTGSAIRELLFLAGICLAAAGALGRSWCYPFISGYKTKSLVMTGPYSICRNPLYFFSAVGMVGIGLCSGTLTITAMMIVFFAVYYPWIIRNEELRLTANHDQDFQQYLQTTPSFWPQLQAYQEPESYTMYPPVLRRNIADGFWFIFLAAAVHVVSELQGSNVLPSLFEVW